MKTLIICAVTVALTITPSLYADPTPLPKASNTRVREHGSVPAGVTAVFIVQLRSDGGVQKVLISRSTGNKTADAQISQGLSFMRFPLETLSKAERAKREIVCPITISAEELKKFRYGPQVQ